jgi:hypothetical protein
MKSSRLPHFRRFLHAPRELLRDPALWAWLLVALLAILPAHAVLAG